MTTIRGCIIGNSHVAALKKAWTVNAGRFPHLALDMFATPMTTLNDTVVENGVFRGTTRRVNGYLTMTGGRRGVRLADYDFIAVAGAGIGFQSLAPLIEGHRPPRMARGPAEQVVSFEALTDAATDVLRQSSGVHVCRMLGGKTDRPLFLMTQPFPSEAVLKRSGKGRSYRLISEAGLDRRFGEVFRSAVRHALDVPVRIVWQDESTLAGPVLTRDVYSRDAVRLNAGLNENHSDNDVFHMNEAYGLVALGSLAASVAGMRPVSDGTVSARTASGQAASAEAVSSRIA